MGDINVVSKKREYMYIILLCTEWYDESWVDMSVIQPMDDSDDGEKFMNWLINFIEDGANPTSTFSFGLYKAMGEDKDWSAESLRELIEDCGDGYTMWDVIGEIADNYDVDVCDMVDIIAEYALSNKDFYDKSLESALNWLNDRKE